MSFFIENYRLNYCHKLFMNVWGSIKNSLITWPASMVIYWNKKMHLHEKRVQLPEDFLCTPSWPPFSLFWNTNMAAVTSCENTLYVLNSRSHNNDRHLRVTRRCFIPLSLFEFLSLTFSLYFQLINFPLNFNTCLLQFYRSITGDHFYNNQSDPNAQLISMLE